MRRDIMALAGVAEGEIVEEAAYLAITRALPIYNEVVQMLHRMAVWDSDY